ncbi:uncharacterized protein KY384_001870 [Bacidia gigantensis]|uniref:uncharacterized protein n=1 Tax=Bacidia gigantensis TaxID=2732470 RepID=UPI001D050BA9|nr:uncharacterized protein KY384_001870 [Bacidia gigantensis]KAG8533087.1 hypothetical protein KY384_001870 [Bacidia gigantensis]
MAPIQFQVGEKYFTANTKTLTEGSAWFKSLFSGSDKLVLKEDGTIFIDRDGDLFAIVLRYLRSQKVPVFYNKIYGHNHLLYDQLLTEARFYQISYLVYYLENRFYAGYVASVKVEILGLDHGVDVPLPDRDDDTDVQYYPQWCRKEVYVCPRRVAVHRGNPGGCGRECRAAQGDRPLEYEDEWVLKTTEIRTQTILKHNMDSVKP